MRPTGDESGEVRHVDQVECADFVGNLAHAGEVDVAGIGTAASDDQFRVLLLGDTLEFVVVDGLGSPGDTVRDDLVGLARKVQRMAVRKMATMRQVRPRTVSPGLMMAA